MDAATDTCIEAFRRALDRATALHGQIECLGIAILRADELPGLIASCDNSVDARWLREEQAAGAHPLRLRLRRVELERELQQALAEAVLHQRRAVDVASRIVTEAAGGRNAASSFPFAMRHLAELKRCRSVPPGATTWKVRLAHLDEAWRAIDAAVAAVPEIRLDVRQPRGAQPQKQPFASSSTTARNSSNTTASGCGS